MYQILEHGTGYPPFEVEGEVPPIGAVIRSNDLVSYEVIDIRWSLSGPTHQANMLCTVVVVQVE